MKENKNQWSLIPYTEALINSKVWVGTFIIYNRAGNSTLARISEDATSFYCLTNGDIVQGRHIVCVLVEHEWVEEGKLKRFSLESQAQSWMSENSHQYIFDYIVSKGETLVRYKSKILDNTEKPQIVDSSTWQEW